MKRGSAAADQYRLDLVDDWQLEQRVSARARYARIEVRSSTQVRLVIPQRMSTQAAQAFLHSRREWIEAQLQLMRQRHRHAPFAATTALRWDGSDPLLLRGQARPLQLQPSTDQRIRVQFDDAAVVLHAPASASTAQRVAALLNALRRQAGNEALQALRRHADRLGVDFVGPRIGDPRSRWGSCTARGLISLSWRLLLAPPAVMDYVVIHELCHRRHLDHSAAFWRCVETMMPDFGEHRRWLGAHGRELHSWLSAEHTGIQVHRRRPR